MCERTGLIPLLGAIHDSSLPFASSPHDLLPPPPDPHCTKACPPHRQSRAVASAGLIPHPFREDGTCHEVTRTEAATAGSASCAAYTCSSLQPSPSSAHYGHLVGPSCTVPSHEAWMDQLLANGNWCRYGRTRCATASTACASVKTNTRPAMWEARRSFILYFLAGGVHQHADRDSCKVLEETALQVDMDLPRQHSVRVHGNLVDAFRCVSG